MLNAINLVFSLFAVCLASTSLAQELTYPPNGQAVARDRDAAFLKRPSGLDGDVQVAKSPPTVDFLYY